MANIQRTKNDMATIDRREIADKVKRDSRIYNDNLTIERRNKADKIIEESRLRNDEMTTNRRKMNDRNPWRTLAICLLIIIALAIGVFYFFIN
ncbi:MAG: hypothetical protein WC781_00510 [Candidatus Pacearchaeota archaeon]|jgi:hypothetical protein